jgi:hypothetical protein
MTDLSNEAAVLAWLTRLEERFGVSDKIGTCSRCETGGIYVTVRSSPSTLKTPEEAWIIWAREFARYIADHGGKIYWRKKPELVCVDTAHIGEMSITMVPPTYLVSAKVFVDDKLTGDILCE